MSGLRFSILGSVALSQGVLPQPDDNPPIPYEPGIEYQLGYSDPIDGNPEAEDQLFSRFQLFEYGGLREFHPPSMSRNGFPANVSRGTKPSDLYKGLVRAWHSQYRVSENDAIDALRRFLDHTGIDMSVLVEQKTVIKPFNKLKKR